ncbi:pyruvate decarboxylase [Diaporthe sp. PMI_573]|nr:pyruvate decarboxylase [Diaporthaceae sp. PMI_573]
MGDENGKQKLKSPVDLAEYLFRRLHQMGVRSVHGVPGDYNLTALDYLEKAELKWVGNVNELNAAYAADGYARLKGISAIVTTFGVGELSAINGIAGAFAEYVPIVNIVGCPSRTAQRNQAMLHHTLGNADFSLFSRMSSQISCYMADLDDHDESEAPALIDEALRQCWVQSKPTYIKLPTDMVGEKVEGERLKAPIDLTEPKNEEQPETDAVDAILRHVYAAKSPIILADAGALRYRVLSEIYGLARKTGLSIFVTPMGKGAVAETDRLFGGVYAGHASLPEVKKHVEEADLILCVGALMSDFNTGHFTSEATSSKTIYFHNTHCLVRWAEYRGLQMRWLLRSLTEAVEPQRLDRGSPPSAVLPISEHQGSSQTIKHSWLWPRLGEFLRHDDIVVTETGTANFGILDTKFPTGVTPLSQVLWGSVGWSVGALQGASLAAQDAGKYRRALLFVGDGSLQLTAQELGTIIRHGLKPLIFVISNAGFTIERTIHGREAVYNDILGWDHEKLLEVFRSTLTRAKYHQVKTRDELDKLLEDTEFKAPKHLHLVELYMEKEDIPRALKLTSEASG